MSEASIKMFVWILIALWASSGLLMWFNIKVNNTSRNIYLSDKTIVRPSEIVGNLPEAEQHPILIIEHYQDRGMSPAIWSYLKENMQEIFKNFINPIDPSGKVLSPLSDIVPTEHNSVFYYLKYPLLWKNTEMNKLLQENKIKILVNNLADDNFFPYRIYYLPAKYLIPYDATLGIDKTKYANDTAKLYKELINALDVTCRLPHTWDMMCN